MTSREAIPVAGRNFAEDLAASARENPVSAALIGMGVLWMFAGSSNVARWGKKIPEFVSDAKDGVASVGMAGARTVTEGISAAAASLGDAAASTLDAVAEHGKDVGLKVSQAMDGAAGALDSSKSVLTRSAQDGGKSMDTAVQQSVVSGREYAASVQETLADVFDRQPLLLGALGLALGAGVAASFATTAAESQLMGDTAESTKKRIMATASEVSTSASAADLDSIEEMKRESQRLGLTPAALHEGVGRVSDKVKNLADVAQGSLRNRTA